METGAGGLEMRSDEEPEVGSGGGQVESDEEPEVGSDEGPEVGSHEGSEVGGSEVESDEEPKELSEESETEETSSEQLLAMGKKCLAACDAAGAVDHFQEACSIL